MRVLVCGGRDYTNIETITRVINELPPGTVVIHGGCRGADSIAGGVAHRRWYEIDTIVFTPDWNRYGRRAGPKRNQRMLFECKPDLVIAFHTNIEESKGTKDMVTRARRAGIPVQIYT